MRLATSLERRPVSLVARPEVEPRTGDGRQAGLTIRDIVGLWGPTPTRESVLANHVDLARYRNTFPTWNKKLRKAMRKAAGVRPPNDPRLA